MLDARCWILDARRFEFTNAAALKKKLFAADFLLLARRGWMIMIHNWQQNQAKRQQIPNSEF